MKKTILALVFSFAFVLSVGASVQARTLLKSSYQTVTPDRVFTVYYGLKINSDICYQGNADDGYYDGTCVSPSAPSYFYMMRLKREAKEAREASLK